MIWKRTSIIQNIMNPTSLHNILSRESSPLRENELHFLFDEPSFSRFELKDLHQNKKLMQNSIFAFFMQILERWNKKVSNGRQQCTEMEYRKNEFIFSWVKRAAVQNNQNMDSSLKKLYEWYASNLDNQVVCRVRGENVYRSRLEDWEIRNSYKSNMPLEYLYFYAGSIIIEGESSLGRTIPVFLLSYSLRLKVVRSWRCAGRWVRS